VTISTVTVNATHEVFNQPPPFADVDLFAGDAALAGAAAAFAAGAPGKQASRHSGGLFVAKTAYFVYGVNRAGSIATGRFRPL
jgi:hypothetical protein